MVDMNHEQLEAVQSKSLRKLVVAGPGSGKTKTMVAAVSAKLFKGVPPASVVVITFTNTAAAEFALRLEAETGMSRRRFGFIGTFHAFLFSLLRKHGGSVGLRASLSVIDADAEAGVLEDVISDLGVKCSVKQVADAVATRSAMAGDRTKNRPHELAAKEFHSRLRKAGVLTFDTIIYYGERLVSLWATDGVEVEWPYRCLFVDEVQDSSASEWRVYDAMPCETKFLVGDTDQSVYKFRGANPDQFTDRVDLAGNPAAAGERWELHTLETNYRSCSAICQSAQSLIEHNRSRVSKRTVPARTELGQATALSFRDPAEEVNFVADQVSRLGHWDAAVLCRTNAMARDFAAALRSRGVCLAEKSRRVDPADWRAAKLAVAVYGDPANDFAQYHLLSAVKGKDAADKARSQASRALRPVNDFVFQIYDHENVTVEGFLRRIGVSSESVERVSSAADAVCNQNGYTSTSDILLYLSSQDRENRDVGDGVVCGTIHSVKGREFGVVFVCGMEEGTFPSSNATKDGVDAVEEERRLCFVAMTRAKDRLVLTRSESRPQPRGPNLPPGPLTHRVVSRFVRESGL